MVLAFSSKRCFIRKHLVAIFFYYFDNLKCWWNFSFVKVQLRIGKFKFNLFLHSFTCIAHCFSFLYFFFYLYSWGFLLDQLFFNFFLQKCTRLTFFVVWWFQIHILHQTLHEIIWEISFLNSLAPIRHVINLLSLSCKLWITF